MKAAGDELYEKLSAAGIETIYDDRDDSAGIKFNDADLLGMPVQIIIGKKNLEAGQVEIKNRATGERVTAAIDSVIEKVKEIIG